MEIIIIGAGIAGFSAGIALRRAGHTVTILEQSSLLHEVGAAISIAPNASPVLRSWGFSIEKAQMVAIKRASVQNGTTGQMFIPDYYKNVEQYGAPVYAVHRVDLHSQLRELAVSEQGEGQPCQLHIRSRVVKYDPENAEVSLADGQTFKADLIVAADGVHSDAKSYVLDKDEVIQSNTGWASMRWLLPTEDLSSDPATAHLVEDSTQRYFIGKEGGGLVWYMCRNNKVQNFLYMSKTFAPAATTEDFHSGIDPSMAVEYGKKDFRPEIQTVLGKAKEVKFWKLIARAPYSRWHRDRLVMIGDAAHPMLPFQAQGGGQAIEDAAALGELLPLKFDKTVLEERLNLFEKVRHDRGSTLQMLSNQAPPMPESVLQAIQKYLPEGTSLKEHDDITRYVFSFDVRARSRAVLAEHEQK